MSDYLITLFNSLINNEIMEYYYCYIIPLFILYILGLYFNFQFKRIEKYIEEKRNDINKDISVLIMDNTKIIGFINEKINKQNTIMEQDISKITNKFTTNIDDIYRAITFTNSRTEEKINESIDREITIINAGICEIQRKNNKEFQDIYKTIATLQDNLKMHTIEDSKYQTWIGIGEFLEEGKYKYTAEIKIINKCLHTFAENKRWMESVDDANVDYKDLLMNILKMNGEDYHTLPQGKTSTVYGLSPYSYSNKYDDNNLEISYCTYEWYTSIELCIKVNRIYDNSSNYRKYNLFDYLLKFIKINWKKSLESC